MVDTRNPFLSAVGARLRRGRDPYPSSTNVTVGAENVDGYPFIRVWFRTAGCTYDRQGLCTMCNYGVSDGIPKTVAGDIRTAIQAAHLDPHATLLVSPSGSMFDPREVPDDTRVAILEAVAETAAGTVVCETRPETVTDDRMAEFVAAIAPKEGVIELGLESADPWVLQWCVNKRLDLAQFKRAVETCHNHGIRVLANISLGTAFLSPGAAIGDAERAVRWAMAIGVDACVVFPMQVREWTLLSWLWRHELYEPPSLWSLIEVLRRTAPEYPGRVSAAWYRDYNADLPQAAVSMPILASPSTCPLCVHRVIESLDQYRGSASVGTLDGLTASACACRDAWIESIANTAIDLDLVTGAYAAVGASVMGQAWWADHRDRVLADLVASRAA